MMHVVRITDPETLRTFKLMVETKELSNLKSIYSKCFITMG